MKDSMNVDIAWMIIRLLQPRHLLSLSHTSKLWRHGIYSRAQEYRRIMPIQQVHRIEKLSGHHMMLCDTSRNELPFGYTGLALSVTSTQLDLLSQINIPVSSFHLTNHSSFQLSVVPRVMHHVEVHGHCFTNTALFELCPAAVTLTQCDISRIDAAFWLYPPSRVQSIQIHMACVAPDIFVTCLLAYDQSTLVAAEVSDWSNSMMDIVFTKAPTLTIRDVPAYRLRAPRVECHTMHLECRIGYIEAPNVRVLHMERGDCYFNPENMPKLEQLTLGRLNPSVYHFPNLRVLRMRSPRYTSTISMNSNLETLVIEECEYQVCIGTGNTKLHQVQTTPEIYYRHVVGLPLKLAPITSTQTCKPTALHIHHQSLVSGN